MRPHRPERTFRIAIVLVGAAAASLGMPRPGTAFEPAAIVRLAPSVVRIEALGSSGRINLGSGVVVDKETVVTNCHVTRAATKVSVARSGTVLPATAQTADTARDLCLLQVPGLQAQAVPLGKSSQLRNGQPVLALGFTGGFGPQVSLGQVIALHRWEGANVIESSTGFTSGASGGGLFDARGELVGVLTFRLRGTQGSYFAAPVDWLRQQMAAPVHWRSVAPLVGGSFWEQQEAAQPFFLRAAALEHGRQWSALAQLADGWTRNAADDPEASYMLAVAEEGLGRFERAIAAWQRSLRIDNDHHRSHIRLARLYHRLGRSSEMRQVLEALTERSPTLGRQLAEELALPAQAAPSK